MSRKPWAQSTELLRVMAELGAGGVSEGRIRDKSGIIVEGCCTHGRQRTIVVDPSYSLVSVIVHELLHRLHPAWGEAYTERRTTGLMHQLTVDQLHTIADEYKRRVTPKARETYIDGDTD